VVPLCKGPSCPQIRTEMGGMGKENGKTLKGRRCNTAQTGSRLDFKMEKPRLDSTEPMISFSMDSRDLDFKRESYKFPLCKGYGITPRISTKYFPCGTANPNGGFPAWPLCIATIVAKRSTSSNQSARTTTSQNNLLHKKVIIPNVNVLDELEENDLHSTDFCIS